MLSFEDIRNRNGAFYPYDKNGKLFSNFIPRDVMCAQNKRVYGDEIPLPDEKFIADRVVNYLARKWDYWCGSAMVAYAKLLKSI